MRGRVSAKSWTFFITVSAAFLALVAYVSVRHFRKEAASDYEQSAKAKHRPTTGEQNKIPEKTGTPDMTAKEFVHAWNKGNAKNVAGLFVSDGVLIIPAGSSIHSRAEIEKTISEKRDGMSKGTTLSNTVDDVSQPDADTAVVKGSYQLAGISILGFSTTATGSYVLRQIKREVRWLISRAEVIRDEG